MLSTKTLVFRELKWIYNILKGNAIELCDKLCFVAIQILIVETGLQKFVPIVS